MICRLPRKGGRHESEFDTEALLQNLTKKLLELVRYDYSGIAIPPRSSITTQPEKAPPRVPDPMFG